GRWMARAVTRMVGRVAVRAKVDETLVRFATHLAYAAMLAFVVLTALGRVGIDTTSFTAVVAAAGLAVGFALQGSLSNLAAGVMLIMFKPFKVGDTVQAGGSTGTVLEIQIFNTLIRTEANALVYVPNSSITSATITNFSAEQIRRIDLVVKCSYDNDLREVKRLLVEILDGDERVLRLPPPLVAVDQLGDSAINFLVQPWVRNEYYSAVRADLLEAIKLGFEDRGIRFAGQTRPTPTPAPAPPTTPQLGIVKAA
ncbi:MAG TPA: mechanosensitive ion channel, partial [Pirellulaceae bacterium]|nr:mechanosensitive ion channel [Pirellulaceae bacterium]